MASTDWIVCLNSSNRLPTPGKPVTDAADPNPTNDVKINMEMSVPRAPVKSIELVTFELPTVQLLIEEQWSTLYFSLGITLPLSTMSRRLTITDDSFTYTAEIPPTFNPLVAIDDTDPTTPIFTTQVPHLLETCPQFWTWGELLATVGTVNDTVLTDSDGKLLPQVTVLSPTTFSVSGFSPATVWIPTAGTTTFGNLLYPKIPTQEYLVTMLNSLLNQAVRDQTSIQSCNFHGNVFRVQYDIKTGMYIVSFEPKNFKYLPSHFYTSVFPVEHDSLPNLMGYSVSTVKLVEITTSNMCNTRTVEECQKEELRELKSSSVSSLGECRAKLTPGNYDTGEQLVQELNFQFNRLLFEDSSEWFRVTDEFGGSDIKVTVTEGLYNPTSFAQSLTEQLAPNNITVTYVSVGCDSPGQFVLSSPDVFVLDFTDPDSANLAKRMGFQIARYTCETEYRSNISFEFPFCKRGYPGCVFYFGFTHPQSKRMTITVSKPKPLLSTAPTTGVLLPNNQLEITNTSLAHGYQVGDLVSIETSTAEVYEFRVVQVDSGTQFVVDMEATNPTGTANISVTKADCCTLSLLFAFREENGLLQQLAGFPFEDILWQPSNNNTIVAPYLIDLVGFNYVLVRIIDPIGSSHIEHVQVPNRTNSMTGIIAKLVLTRIALRILDGYYPMKINFYSPKIVTSIQVQILNPNGSLYQLHGFPWTATLRLSSGP